jgi:hypothetical protein
MGYRSQVKAVFYTKNEEKWPMLKLYVEENFPKEWSLERIESSHYYGYVFSAGDIKWYESYPDVQAFDAFVDAYRNLIDSESSTLSWTYEFIRIGEDSTDIETDSEGDCSYLLTVSRQIETDF